MFKRYESLTNDYRFKPEFVKDYDDYKFVVTEKVHGSNFQFYVTQDDVKMGKRNSLLKDENEFYPHAVSIIKDKYIKYVRNIFDLLYHAYEDLECVIIYGELYGGGYPAVKNSQR